MKNVSRECLILHTLCPQRLPLFKTSFLRAVGHAEKKFFIGMQVRDDWAEDLSGQRVGAGAGGVCFFRTAVVVGGWV